MEIVTATELWCKIYLPITKAIPLHIQSSSYISIQWRTFFDFNFWFLPSCLTKTWKQNHLHCIDINADHCMYDRAGGSTLRCQKREIIMENFNFFILLFFYLKISLFIVLNKGVNVFYCYFTSKKISVE